MDPSSVTGPACVGQTFLGIMDIQPEIDGKNDFICNLNIFLFISCVLF